MPFPSPGNLPNPKVEPRSPALQEESLQQLSHKGSSSSSREAPATHRTGGDGEGGQVGSVRVCTLGAGLREPCLMPSTAVNSEARPSTQSETGRQSGRRT